MMGMGVLRSPFSCSLAVSFPLLYILISAYCVYRLTPALYGRLILFLLFPDYISPSLFHHPHHS